MKSLRRTNQGNLSLKYTFCGVPVLLKALIFAAGQLPASTSNQAARCKLNTPGKSGYCLSFATSVYYSNVMRCQLVVSHLVGKLRCKFPKREQG
jgi:hypothetical protein